MKARHVVIWAVLVAAFLFAGQASAAPGLMRYIQPWCVDHGGEISHRLDTGKVVDCMTNEYAVEFARAPQWETAIGGAMYRAAVTGLKPGVVLIVGDGQMTYEARLHKTTDMQVWIVPEQQ